MLLGRPVSSNVVGNESEEGLSRVKFTWTEPRKGISTGDGSSVVGTQNLPPLAGRVQIAKFSTPTSASKLSSEVVEVFCNAVPLGPNNDTPQSVPAGRPLSWKESAYVQL